MNETAEISLKSENDIYQLGRALSTQISKKSADLCQHLKGNELSKEVTEDLKNLVKFLKKRKAPEESNIISRTYYSVKNKISDLKVEHANLDNSIEEIIERFNLHETNLKRDLSELDTFREFNKNSLVQLDELIASASASLNELDKEIKEAETKPDKTYQDVERIEEQRLTHLQLSKKILELEQVKAICMQTNQQIRIIKTGHINLLNKLNECKAIAIPLWRNAFYISFVINNQQEASEIIDMTSAFTNNLIISNSKELKESSFKIAKQSSETVIKNESIKISMSNLVETTKGCRAIQIEQSKKIREQNDWLKQSSQQLIDAVVDEKILKSKLISNK